jgi:hypothetical protein
MEIYCHFEKIMIGVGLYFIVKLEDSAVQLRYGREFDDSGSWFLGDLVTRVLILHGLAG